MAAREPGRRGLFLLLAMARVMGASPSTSERTDDTSSIVPSPSAPSRMFSRIGTRAGQARAGHFGGEF